MGVGQSGYIWANVCQEWVQTGQGGWIWANFSEEQG